MAASEGSIFKVCRCRNPETGKPFGTGCPRLRRANDSWNPDHGVWAYQYELPPTAEGRRRQLRFTGYPTRTAVQDEVDQVRRLLDLAGTHKQRLVEMGDLLQRAVCEVSVVRHRSMS